MQFILSQQHDYEQSAIKVAATTTTAKKRSSQEQNETCFN